MPKLIPSRAREVLWPSRVRFRRPSRLITASWAEQKRGAGRFCGWWINQRNDYSLGNNIWANYNNSLTWIKAPFPSKRSLHPAAAECRLSSKALCHLRQVNTNDTQLALLILPFLSRLWWSPVVFEIVAYGNPVLSCISVVLCFNHPGLKGWSYDFFPSKCSCTKSTTCCCFGKHGRGAIPLTHCPKPWVHKGQQLPSV